MAFDTHDWVAAATDADLKDKTICEIPIVANHDVIVDYACENGWMRCLSHHVEIRISL